MVSASVWFGLILVRDLKRILIKFLSSVLIVVVSGRRKPVACVRFTHARPSLTAWKDTRVYLASNEAWKRETSTSENSLPVVKSSNHERVSPRMRNMGRSGGSPTIKQSRRSIRQPLG